MLGRKPVKVDFMIPDLYTAQIEGKYINHIHADIAKENYTYLDQTSKGGEKVAFEDKICNHLYMAIYKEIENGEVIEYDNFGQAIGVSKKGLFEVLLETVELDYVVIYFEDGTRINIKTPPNYTLKTEKCSEGLQISIDIEEE